MKTIHYPEGATLQLFDAVRWAEVDQLLEAIHAGADANFLDENGDAPLHVALKRILEEGTAERHARFRVVYELVQHGGSLELKNVDGLTPAELAQDMASKLERAINKHPLWHSETTVGRLQFLIRIMRSCLNTYYSPTDKLVQDSLDASENAFFAEDQ